VHSRLSRLAQNLANRGGPVAGCLAALAAFVNNEPPLRVAIAAIAAYAALAHAAVASVPAIHIARGVLEGLRRGISYRSPADWDRAGDVSIAAFCARGTVLLGEPELADLESIGKMSAEQVLSLAAGAESASSHPVAAAVRRAASARRIRPNAVRSPVVQPGLGVSAIAASGEPLLVGSRALMLREKVSVALAEQKITDIESHGREVLLVASGGKLAGVIGLQDGLRPGARAAVQHLLDAQVEPVLLSGDSRETCEAIGRALDIEHVRAETLAEDRAREIERLSQGGLTVAVIGRSRPDESALSAAHVAVAMPSPGASGEWAVMLASDDVRDGALAISLARRTNSQARAGLILAFSPPIVFSLLAVFGLLPPACGPLGAIGAAMAAALQARATDRDRLMPSPESRRSSHRLTGRLAKTT
jgi:Cu+-exporting ATPase